MSKEISMHAWWVQVHFARRHQPFLRRVKLKLVSFADQVKKYGTVLVFSIAHSPISKYTVGMLGAEKPGQRTDFSRSREPRTRCEFQKSATIYNHRRHVSM